MKHINKKEMKKFLLLVALIIMCQSCFKTDDDTGNICTTDCTKLKGRFVTKNNEPLKNIVLRLDYKISNPPLGASIRTIKKAKTNENGYYEMDFFLEDSEIGEGARGYFRLFVDASSLSSANFIRNNEVYIGEAIYSLGTRDTIIDKSFYIPTKGHITVTLNGFLPILEGDFFEVRTLFPSGLKIGENDFLGGEYQTASSGYGKFSATTQSQTFNNVFVAANEINIIRIARRKNGNTTHEDFEIFVPENNNIELTYDY